MEESSKKKEKQKVDDLVHELTTERDGPWVESGPLSMSQLEGCSTTGDKLLEDQQLDDDVRTADAADKQEINKKLN